MPPKMHFTYIICSFLPTLPAAPQGGCMQPGRPRGCFLRHLRATGEWPCILTPAPSPLLQSQNCRAWHFDSGIRAQRGFSFYNTDCHPGNRCDRAFFLSQWIKVSLCVSKHKPHAHSLPAHRNWVHYIFLPFFFFLKKKVNVNEECLSL